MVHDGPRPCVPTEPDGRLCSRSVGTTNKGGDEWFMSLAGQKRAVLPIERLEVTAYTVPTDAPESDGTYEWDRTTMVIVELAAGDEHGLGFTYADTSCVTVVRQALAELVVGQDAFDVIGTWSKMVGRVRNLGRPGVAATAISAIDGALWDLKARLLGLPLAVLLGRARDRVPIYGSGGFTSYTESQLTRQLAGWVEQGIPRVKMKVGRDAAADRNRVQAARTAIGTAELFVDANGAYDRQLAARQSRSFGTSEVAWFEEPVSSDDLEGLRWLRGRVPPGQEVAAGEYGYDLWYFRRMLEAGAVDALQADATRCLGITGFMQAAVLADAFQVPLSAHCAPALHVHPACAARRLRHIEYFHDHTRIERLFFDGLPTLSAGTLQPDWGRPGHGLVFKRKDASVYAA
jgi:L-alanine-DL-glutamate epimerase-like enolase superfamily enzyme